MLKIRAEEVRHKGDSTEERDAAVERLREFLRFNYITTTERARHLGVPAESGSGTAPTGYEYREYKGRGIPKPRRCPFCKNAKGKIRKVRGGFQGVCPNCGATGPKQDSDDRASSAWNGKDAG